MEDFDSIQDEWERLLPSCSTNTVFVTPGWQRVWWQHFGGTSELHILSVRDGDRLVGIAPLVLKGETVSFVGDGDLFDYLDFVVPRGSEAPFYAALWDHLTELDWHTLDLSSLPQGSPTLAFVSASATMAGATVDVAEEEVTPIVCLPSSWDEYLARLTRKDRHELRRKLRRLERADSPCQYICSDPDTLPSHMQDFFRLLRASSADKMAFLTPEREGFFLDIALELTSRDQFKLYFLEVKGVRVAACICFDYANSYLLYNSGYDPTYSDLSVGLLNKALCIRDAIEGGRRLFNFLKGTERYKYNLGGKNQSVYRLVAHR